MTYAQLLEERPYDVEMAHRRCRRLLRRETGCQDRKFSRYGKSKEQLAYDLYELCSGIRWHVGSSPEEFSWKEYRLGFSSLEELGLKLAAMWY